jgi:hypothetical protein
VGFTIQYRTTAKIDDAKADAIRAAVVSLLRGRTWLSCEPVHFYFEQMDGRLLGFSKPNFMPHPDDVASAEAQGLPDGTVRDVIDVLCELSRTHGVDWEFAHDHDPGPIGFIRNGVADRRLLEQIEGIAGLADMMGEMTEGEFDEEEEEEDEGDGPPILPFRPRG